MSLPKFFPEKESSENDENQRELDNMKEKPSPGKLVIEQSIQHLRYTINMLEKYLPKQDDGSPDYGFYLRAKAFLDSVGK